MTAWIAAVALLVVGLATAHADDEPSFRLGDQGWAELEGGESLEISFHANRGDRLDLKLKVWRGSDLRPELALVGPDSVAIDLTGLAKANKKGNRVQLKRYVAPRTGLFRLTITDTGDGEGGGFDLASKLKPAKKFGDTLDATRDETPLPFTAYDGDEVRLQVKTKRKGPSIRIADLELADGTLTRLGVAKKTDWLPVTADGEHAFHVEAEDDTPGTFRYKIKLKARKRTKGRPELEPHVATTSLQGRLIVPGHTEPSDREGPGKGRAVARERRSTRLGELIVGGELSADEALDRLHGRLPGARFELLRSLTDQGPHLIGVHGLRARSNSRRNQARTRVLARALDRLADVDWVEANLFHHRSRTPSDSLWAAQEGMRQINLPKAWDATTGDGSVVVAVVDSGIWPSHPDFAGRLVPGYDFVGDVESSRDGDGWDSNPKDDALDFHGTHVAGIVAAAGNDRTGITGVLWNGRILPVRGLGADGGTIFDLAAAVRWAVGLPVNGVPTNQNPAQVVNMSYGAFGFSSVEAQSMSDAAATGAVLVAAAGNSSTTEREYPAGYNEVISVAAVGPDLRYASYSNYGNSITICAPGGDSFRGLPGVLSTYVDEFTLQPTHRALDGTSMASPHVAGAAALLLTAKPELTPGQIRDAITTTALDLGPPGFDIDYGWGLIDVGSMIELHVGPIAIPPELAATPSTVTVFADDPVARVALTNVGAGDLDIFRVTSGTQDGANWLTAEIDSGRVPTTLTVTVDPARAPPFTSRGTVFIRSSGGDLDVPVRLLRLIPPAVGTVRVVALDEAGEEMASTLTDADQGFEWELDGLAAGRYRLIALLDRNGDQVIDQVSEWFGEYPVTGQSEPIEIDPSAPPSSVEFTLARVDAGYDFRGAGGGSIKGAVAVRATDAESGQPIPAARLVVGDGLATATTDENGRAVAFGAFFGEQDVTVHADGYETRSRIDLDAQFSTFELRPRVSETLDVSVEITGLVPTDTAATIQIGSLLVEQPRTNQGLPIRTTLEVPRTDGSTPIWCVVTDADGDVTALGRVEFDGKLAPAALNVAVEVERAPEASRTTPAFTTLLPLEHFELADSVFTYDVRRVFSARHSLRLGADSLILGIPQTVTWSAGADEDEPTLLRIDAEDTRGRRTSRIAQSETGSPEFPEQFRLPAPVELISPTDGTGVSPTARLSWIRGGAANVQLVEIEGTLTDDRWTLLLDSVASSVVLPELPGAGLTRGGTYRWRVRTLLVSDYSHDEHRSDQLAVGVETETTSEWAEFTVQ